jgi:hypothetical protein
MGNQNKTGGKIPARRFCHFHIENSVYEITWQPAGLFHALLCPSGHVRY